MREKHQPTPEISANPAEVLQELGQNPAFENRLMASFFEDRVDAGSMRATQQGRIVTLFGPITDSQLALKLNNRSNINDWRLLIQNLHRDPDQSGYLVEVYRQNMIGAEDRIGGLEGDFHRGLNHPDASDVLRVLAELSDMDRQTRNIVTVLEGYSPIKDPVTKAYIKLIGDFSDPARLRVSEGYVKNPPDKVAGIIDDPRLEIPSSIILDLHGKNTFSQDKSAFCWVHWWGDRGEDSSFPLQTVFGYDPESGLFSYAEGTAGLKRGTLRHELSKKMLKSLNEGFRDKPTELMHRGQSSDVLR